MLQDVIIGTVIDCADHDAVALLVEEVQVSGCSRRYQECEVVHADAAAMGDSDEAATSRHRLILDSRVRCRIDARDQHGMLRGHIDVLDELCDLPECLSGLDEYAPSAWISDRVAP